MLIFRLWPWLLVLLIVVIPAAERRWINEIVPGLDLELEGLDTWRPPTVCTVFDDEGVEIDQFALVRRFWVPIEDLPDVAWQAIVAAEDRRFFEHNGIDYMGILRAAYVNIQAGRVREGGSTLTQQLVKNLVVGADRTFGRKFHEALLAWRLEQRMDKMQILELYLNYIYLGSGNYGLEAAAQDYFGVSARELDMGQAAMLAGLIPGPSAWSPRRDQERAADRRRLVLNSMVAVGFVDFLDAQMHKRDPVDPPRRSNSAGESGYAYLTAVRREVRRILGEEVPFQAGLRIYTPLDQELQAVAEQAVRDAARMVEWRQGIPGSKRRAWGDEFFAFLDEAKGLERVVEKEEEVIVRPGPGDCFEAIYVGNGKVRAGPHKFWFAARTWWKRIYNSDYTQPARVLAETARWGDIYEVCLDKNEHATLEEVKWVEGAAVVIENATGHVVALAGGTTMPLEGFNRATQARRQAGSSFKPYVYAAALEAGKTQLDAVMDAPIALDAGNGRIWRPKNAGGGYQGRMTMRRAFALSVNTVAVRLAKFAGIDRVIQLARGAGVRSRMRPDLTLALGSGDVSVLDQAAGISTFSRMGRAIPPVFVRKLVDVRGAEVGRPGEPIRIDGVDAVLPGGEGELVMKPSTAWQVLEMMRGVVRDGTGVAAYVPGQDRGGKTGTTTGFADAWFVGFTPQHTIAVWIGRDERRTLGKGEAGGRAALPAWMAIADALPKERKEPLVVPDDILRVPHDGRWVGIREDQVRPTRLNWWDPGDLPLPTFPGDIPEPCPEPEDELRAAAEP